MFAQKRKVGRTAEHLDGGLVRLPLGVLEQSAVDVSLCFRKNAKKQSYARGSLDGNLGTVSA